MSNRPTQIQIVTDQPVILSAVSRAYRNKPVNIVTATNAGEAQAQLDVFEFDLFLLDMDIKEECSFDLLAVMTKRFPLIPMIIMTTGNYHSKKLIAKIDTLRLGRCWRLLEKPFDYKKLIDFIAMGVSGRKHNDL